MSGQWGTVSPPPPATQQPPLPAELPEGTGCFNQQVCCRIKPTGITGFQAFSMSTMKQGSNDAYGSYFANVCRFLQGWLTCSILTMPFSQLCPM